MDHPRDNRQKKHSGFKNNNVIITVYVESSILLHANQYAKHHPQPSASERGYNRRAELLAYSNQLRRKGLKEADTPKIMKKAITGHVKRKQAVSFSKGCEWFPSRMLTTKRQWRYEKIEPKEERSLHKQPKGSNWKAQVSSAMKELSSSLKCNKVDDCNRYVIKKTIRMRPRI